MQFLEDLHIIHSWVGLLHTVAAVFSLLFGTLVFLNKKGTKKHKFLGYIYFFNMLILNISAFGIYNFNGFSVFHGFAVISLISIFMGILPAWLRKNQNWIVRHFYFMNWSVVGLYCAFWAEIGVRFFDMQYFWWVVMLATILTSALGAFFIEKKAKEISIR